MARLIVDAWHSECGECGLGKGGPFSTNHPHKLGFDILTPAVAQCPRCEAIFTEIEDVYAGKIISADENPYTDDDYDE